MYQRFHIKFIYLFRMSLEHPSLLLNKVQMYLATYKTKLNKCNTSHTNNNNYADTSIKHYDIYNLGCLWTQQNQIKSDFKIYILSPRESSGYRFHCVLRDVSAFVWVSVCVCFYILLDDPAVFVIKSEGFANDIRKQI